MLQCYIIMKQRKLIKPGLLKNEIAVQVSIRIMDAFVEMRKFLYYNGQIFERLINMEYKMLEQNKKLNEHDSWDMF